MDDNTIRVRRALVSVSDKGGLADFAQALTGMGIELISTGGTARYLKERGVPITPVSQVTNFPEIMDGRVKTLHPNIHAGILADRLIPDHLRAMEELGIKAIDLVVVNLYPFEATVAHKGVTETEAIENIDIGGPTMVRAAAKNFTGVAVVVNPSDYEAVLNELKANEGALTLRTRKGLAKKAFNHTAHYDAAIAAWFNEAEGDFPRELHLEFRRAQSLRYGENPHQSAAFYADTVLPGEPTLGGAVQLQGKELSYNNIVDIDAALQLALEFAGPAAVIIKHTSPSGVGTSKRRLVDAFRKARECDPVSAFGGVLGFNRPVNGETAREVASTFFERSSPRPSIKRR